MRRLALSAALALMALPALAEMPEGVSHFTLPNGLETVVIEDHRAPVIVQMVWYRIGSADEVPGKSGIAHYLEHLMFKGTDKMAPGELSKTVTANGGMDNAFTSYDYTAYFQRIAADRLPLIMEMESDRMQNLRIGEDDWQAERQVVLEERAQRTDSDPGSLFAEERNAVQFYNHPYGRPVIGWRQEMMGLTREDAIKWYDDHYSPNEAVLILAGDVTPEKAHELAAKYYGPIPARGEAAPRVRPQEPAQQSPRRMQMQDARVAQPTMIRSYLVPERNPGDQKPAAILTVLAELLGGSMQTSVLGRELALPGKALWVNAGYDGLSVDPTTFVLSLVPAQDVTPPQAEDLLNTALASFAASGPAQADLERVKTRIRAARIYARDSAHGRAYDYGQGLSTGLTIEDVNDWPDILSSVTADEVRTAAQQLIDNKATVTGWLLPAPQENQTEPQPAAMNRPIQAPATEVQQ
ncbi:M16 family metallopeptidase [Paracoccus sp. (in: a-proteobacteria)]|uniref:M16 family metallopeptidase n=1 Tax=Paracoccus sp. TaxID=267 RepID=UPI003A8ABC22